MSWCNHVTVIFSCFTLQVIHHLQPEGSNDFHNIGHFLREVYRVLKTNGALILNFNTPEQACTSNWFLQLFSEQLQEKYAKKQVTFSNY